VCPDARRVLFYSAVFLFSLCEKKKADMTPPHVCCFSLSPSSSLQVFSPTAPDEKGVVKEKEVAAVHYSADKMDPHGKYAPLWTTVFMACISSYCPDPSSNLPRTFLEHSSNLPLVSRCFSVLS